MEMLIFMEGSSSQKKHKSLTLTVKIKQSQINKNSVKNALNTVTEISVYTVKTATRTCGCNKAKNYFSTHRMALTHS